MPAQLALPPFNLSADDQAWVRRTRDSMSTEDRLRQLFVLVQFEDSPAAVQALMSARPGGVHRTWGADMAAAWATTRSILESADIPPFITGDMEGGGYGPVCATPLPNPLGTAAMADADLSRRVAGVLAAETAAMGFSWSYTPVVDIAARLDSAIVGTRSYGSDVATIREQARIHFQAMQAAGIAATAKHWPGEGYDARDQHLVTTVNPLSWNEWHERYGATYRALFEAGIMTVMAGHIAWPAGVRHLRPDAGRDAWRPGSISYELNTRLLREELGFNGLLVSDATTMAGLGSWADRETVVPAVIASGCDMFLFSRDPAEDLRWMLAGLRNGKLSEARVEEAVTRVLGLKAALGLHRRSIDERLAPLEQVRGRLATPGHLRVAQEAADASVTLVKDVHGTLPLDPARHRRIVVISPGIETVWPGAQPGPLRVLLDGLKARGFEVREYDAQRPPTREDTDLVLYLLAKESMMTRSRIYLDWAQLHGGDPRQSLRRYWHEIPTAMVSFGHPAYLVDAPRMPLYINAYSAIEPVQRAVLAGLLGERPFTGRSPVDAYCGLEDAHW